MASSTIHMCIANEINKTIKVNTNLLLIGSIAPDLSKLCGDSKFKSHFFVANDGVPQLDIFLKKYKQNLNNDFVLGYYIHLYTDYLWVKNFINNFIDGTKIYKLDGTIEQASREEIINYIYNDYSNLNFKLINKYKLDLSIIYDKIPYIDSIIEEIRIDKIQLLINKICYILDNSTDNENCIFNMEQVNSFIELATKIIIEKLKKLSII